MVSKTLHVNVITFTFLTFFQNPKKRDFLRFLLCCIRFLELWLHAAALRKKYASDFFVEEAV